MLEVISKRRSCRSFDITKDVEEEKLNEIINAGLLAPSGMNLQNSVIFVIKDKETREKLVKLNASIMGSNTDPFYGAPVILLVAYKKDQTGLGIYDSTLTIENMMLEATNQGLASIWIHRAKQEVESKEGKEILSFSGLNLDEYEGVGHVAIGYPKNPKYSEKTILPNRVFIK